MVEQLRVKAPPMHDGQQQVWRHTARFKVVAAGRRWGKSWFDTYYALNKAFSGGRCWIVTPTYKQSEENFSRLQRVAAQLPRAMVTVFRVDMRVIFSPGGKVGGMIECKSGDRPDNLRGAGLDLAVLDEAAYLRPEVWQNVVMPALADRQGEAVFASSPNGRNWFWQLYTRGLDPHYPDWQSWHFPTSSNPTIDPAEIEAARGAIPERVFRQEWLAEFTEDSGAVFRNVDTVCAGVVIAPETGKRYVYGVDWARHHDFTVITVFDPEQKRLVYMDRFNGVSWNMQRNRLLSITKRYTPRVIWAEANSIGEPNIEALQAMGLPVKAFFTTQQSKSEVIDALALALESEKITLLRSDVLRDELKAYELERLPSGKYRYNAPSGMHDDTVIAVALGWHGVTHAYVPVGRTYKENPFF